MQPPHDRVSYNNPYNVYKYIQCNCLHWSKGIQEKQSLCVSFFWTFLYLNSKRERKENTPFVAIKCTDLRWMYGLTCHHCSETWQHYLSRSSFIQDSAGQLRQQLCTRLLNSFWVARLWWQMGWNCIVCVDYVCRYSFTDELPIWVTSGKRKKKKKH